jgi:hypothetical protein
MAPDRQFEATLEKSLAKGVDPSDAGLRRVLGTRGW